MRHKLFKTGDPGVPDAICDSNGEVVLGQCKICGRAEADLTEDCIWHDDLVRALVKPGHQVLADLTPDMADAIHMTLGIAGEAGELVDAVKKAAIYCRPLDRENVIEELGDLEFYMEGLRQRLGITRQETIEHNIEKLSIRYKGAYSNEAAIARADKTE